MNRLPTKNPHVVFKRVTDGAVLLSTHDEVYFGLDPVGAQIWELLPPEREDFDTLCDALCERYPDVDRKTIAADALEFIQNMLSAGLLLPGDEANADDRAKADPT